MGELNAYGIYIPIFLVQAVGAYMVFKLVSIFTNPWVDKGWVAFPGVFNICLYIILLMVVHEMFLMFWGL